VPGTLWELLTERAARTPGAVALTVAGEAGSALTYAQLAEQAERFASGLASLGLARGDALAVWLPNSIEWVIAEFAAARLGLLVVGLNPRYKAREIGHLLAVAQARAIVMCPQFHDHDYGNVADQTLAETRLPALETLILAGNSGSGWQPAGGLRTTTFPDLMVSARAAGAPAGRPADVVNVFGTSGTASFPKLAGHDQQSVVRHARDAAVALEFAADEVMLAFLPFCGVYGFVALMSVLSAGGRAAILPAYSVGNVIDAFASEGATCMFALESVFGDLFASPRAQARAFASWRKGCVAGLTAERLIRRAEDEFGVALTNPYGSSELFALTATRRPSEPVAVRIQAGGRLISDGMSVRAVDPVTREVLPDGEPGELEFAGYNVTSGYLANPDADASAFTADGWYRTGDLGMVSEGGRALTYAGRLADTLRLRGYLVSPAEIEDLILLHGSVTDVQVVGVPRPETGEDRAVAFVRHDNPPADLERVIRDHCRSQAASWKVPDVVIALTEFPMTPGANGDKVMKTRLREMAIEYLKRAGT
jgi:fatty-acyl-CoA synthase